MWSCDSAMQAALDEIRCLKGTTDEDDIPSAHDASEEGASERR